jgi:hypothetical protein
MVHEVSFPHAAIQTALAERVAEYLRASAVPEPLVKEWVAQILPDAPAEGETNVRGLLLAAQQQMDRWLGEMLGTPSEDHRLLLAARARLPYWQADSQGGTLSDMARAALRAGSLQATPQPAELDMPTQSIRLPSLRRSLGDACREYLPFCPRIHAWLMKFRVRN